MKKINILILTLCLSVIAALAVLALVLGKRPDTLPEDTSLSEGYVCITAGGESRWSALPYRESSLTLRRTMADGSVRENVVTLTPEGAYMQASSCENQDCVQQGVVTLENKEKRILHNMVICLPNDVMIELYSAAELQAMEGGQP